MIHRLTLCSLALLAAALLAAVVLMLGMAQDAHATRWGPYGFEWCEWPEDSGSTLFILDGVTGTDPTVETSGARQSWCKYATGALDAGYDCTTNSDCSTGECLNYSPTNDCYLRHTATTSNTSEGEYADAINSAYTAAAFFARVTTLGSDTDDAVRILRFPQSGSGLAGAVLYAERTSSTTYAWRLYSLTKHNECNGGTTNGDQCTPCTSNSDCSSTCTALACPSGAACATNDDCSICWNPGIRGACQEDCPAETPGEQWCINASKAGSLDTLEVGEWVELKVVEDDSAGNAQQTRITLMVNGIESGSALVDLSACQAGGACDNAGKLCSNNDECTGCSNGCVDINNGNQTGVFIGALTNAGSGSWVIDIDCVEVDDTTDDGLDVRRCFDSHPSADDTPVDWNAIGDASNHFENLDDFFDGTTSNGDAGYERADGGTTEQDQVTLQDLTLLTHDAAEMSTLAGVQVYTLASDNLDKTSGQTEDIRMCLRDASNNDSCGATIDMSDFDTEYRWNFFTRHASKPAGGAWTASAFNGTRLRMENLGNCSGTNCQVRVTAALVETSVEMDAPAIVSAFDDVGTDGETTFLFVADSTGVPAPFHNDLNAFLPAFTNMIFATTGSRTLRNFELAMTAALNGTRGGVMNVQIEKGNSANADYALIMGGINTVNGGNARQNHYCNGGTNHGRCCGDSCSPGYTCTGGTCEAYPGLCISPNSDNGNPCGCNYAHAAYAGGNDNLGGRYCTNNKSSGAIFGDEDSATCNTCSSNSDCLSVVPCAVNTDCDMAYSLDTCNGSVCLGACSGGTCKPSIQPLNGQDVYRYDIARSIFGMQADGCVDSPDCSGVCAMATPLGEAKRSIESIRKIIVSRTGSQAVEPIWIMQGRSVDNGTFAQGSFIAHRKDQDALQAFIRTMAIEQGDKYIDLDSAIDIATHGDNKTFYDDNIHYTKDGGLDLLRDLIRACFENDGGETTDGRCSTTCTAGLVGNTCSTNVDCGLWVCAFVGATNYLNDANCQGAYLFDTTDLGLDSCGGDDPMTDGGTPVRDTGDSMQGASSFDGNSGNNYLICDSDVDCPNVDFRGLSAFTTCGWAKIPTLGGWRGIAAQGYNAGTHEPYFHYSQENGGKTMNAIGQTAGSSEEIGATDITADTWFHSCGVYDGANIIIYLNGEQDCSTSCTAATGAVDTATDAGSVWIGARGNAATTPKDYHQEHLDEVLFFDRALGATEICEICRFGADGTETDRGATCGSCTLP